MPGELMMIVGRPAQPECDQVVKETGEVCRHSMHSHTTEGKCILCGCKSFRCAIEHEELYGRLRQDQAARDEAMRLASGIVY